MRHSTTGTSENGRKKDNIFKYIELENLHSRSRISRWLGRENEENVARTRNCCGCPSSPCLMDPHTSSNLLNYYITMADLSAGRFACYVIQQSLYFNTIGRNVGSKQNVDCKIAILGRGFEPPLLIP